MRPWLRPGVSLDVVATDPRWTRLPWTLLMTIHRPPLRRLGSRSRPYVHDLDGRDLLGAGDDGSPHHHRTRRTDARCPPVRTRRSDPRAAHRRCPGPLWRLLHDRHGSACASAFEQHPTRADGPLPPSCRCPRCSCPAPTMALHPRQALRKAQPTPSSPSSSSPSSSSRPSSSPQSSSPSSSWPQSSSRPTSSPQSSSRSPARHRQPRRPQVQPWCASSSPSSLSTSSSPSCAVLVSTVPRRLRYGVAGSCRARTWMTRWARQPPRRRTIQHPPPDR